MTNSVKKSILPMIIIGILFFIFGFVTWSNSTLIIYFRIACELTDSQAYLVTMAFYISYVFMALPSSYILSKTGFKGGMILGLLVMALGSLLFIPAANARAYELFLIALFVIGTGLTLLQTAVNPYVTILGPIESAAKRISIMGICNKVAGTIAPIILGAIVLSNSDTLVDELAKLDEISRAVKLDDLISKVILPYSIMAGILIVLSIMIFFSPLPKINEEEEEENASNNDDNKTSVFQYPNLVLGVIALFLYVGVEVIAGDTIGPYGESQGIPLSEAKNFTSFTLIAMLVGYVIGILTIPKYITQSKALTYSSISGIIFSLIAIFTSGYTSVLFIALLGFANALMWPAIWPLAIEGLGKFTKTASALLIMGIAGGAIMPYVYGLISSNFAGEQNAYLIMIPCYLFILYYSISGRKLKSWD